MTVMTAGTATALARPIHRGPETYFAFAIFGFGAMIGWVVVPAWRQRRRDLSFVGGCLMLLTILAGCGGGGGGSNTPPPRITPPGTSSITVTMTSNASGTTIAHSMQVNLTITP
jgi:hypothetical protein